MTMLTAQLAAEKFYLRELFLFFIKQRGTVFGHSPEFRFSIPEFEGFIRKENLSAIMNGNTNDITAEKVIWHLDCCKNLMKLDKSQETIKPNTPLLTYAIEEMGVFVIQDCQTEDLKNAIRFIDLGLYTDDWEEESEKRKKENKKTLFSLTQDHKIIFRGQSTSNSLGNKERAFFIVLKDKFPKPVSYTELFEAAKTMNRVNAGILKYKVYSDGMKKGFVNDGVTELRKKLYEISGNPRAIKTEEDGESQYTLTY